MSWDATYVVARWGRPLGELSVNGSIDWPEPEQGVSWRRADGWQCFVPAVAFYGDELVPPVVEIQRETDGPVLGMGVLSDVHWELAFVLDGVLRRVKAGPTDEGSDDDYEVEMVSAWGRPWRRAAADALVSWASSFAVLDARAVAAVLTVPHLSGQTKLVELLRVLTLAPDPAGAWLADVFPASPVGRDEVPDALYAVDAAALVTTRFQPYDQYRTPGLALVVAASGVGVWDRVSRSWLHQPGLSLDEAMENLAVGLSARGWASEWSPDL